MSSAALAELVLSSLDENDFEDWLVVYFQAAYGLTRPPQRYGRRGLAQQGVDVWFRSAQGESIGIQAKAYIKTTLTASAVDDEVALAEAFEPPLDLYLICTLNPRSARLQAHARSKRLHGKPTVELMAVQDLAENAIRHPDVLRDLFARMGAPAVDAFRALSDRPSPVITSATTERDPSQHAALKAAEDWIDAGQPDRALAELERLRGSMDERGWLRVRVRAIFAQSDGEAVIAYAKDQKATADPDPVILAYAAHAAQIAGNDALADELIDSALALAVGADRATVVGSYLRVHAQRAGTEASALEAFAETQLGDLERVALAMADSAFTCGDVERALHWYARARARQAAWPDAAQGNALSAELFHLLDLADRGVDATTRLQEVANDLGTLVRRLTLPGQRVPLLSNLGSARYALRDPVGAAEAWDEALLSSLVPADLWLRRCVLSATHSVTLPSPDLEALWATTPRMRLGLAGACTVSGAWGRARVLLDAVQREPSALDQNDRVLLQLEEIRLETRNADEAITPEHVAAMLRLAVPGTDLPALFIWLIEHHGAAGPEDAEAVRTCIGDMAERAELSPAQRLAIAEDLLSARLDEVVVPWVAHIEQLALDADGEVQYLRAALLLLRLYPRFYRFYDTRRLIERIRPYCLSHPEAALHGARALDEIGDRLPAYEYLASAIEAGQHHIQVLLGWARTAVVVGRRREAHRLLRRLAISPANSDEHAHLLQVRKLLGVQGRDLLPFTAATQVTPSTAGAIFGASLLATPVANLEVAFGRVVRARIELDGAPRIDGDILLMERRGLVVEGLRSYAVDEYPWVTDLIGAVAGEERTLSHAPLVGATAFIVDVFDAERWSFLQAMNMLSTLPEATSGVEAFSGDEVALRNRMLEQLARVASAREATAAAARDHALPIALAAARLRTSPRALLRKHGPWTPQGHPGTSEAIEADVRSLRACDRVVLDPVTVLLVVELDAESLFAGGTLRPVMTRHAAIQLFDWWYASERHQRGTRGHMVPTPHGPALIEVSAVQRRAVARYWKRVQAFVNDHVELVDPAPTTDFHLLRLGEMLGPPILTGMAVSAQRGWAYVTEERMLRNVCAGLLETPTCPLHQVIVAQATDRVWPNAKALRSIATLITWGWRWVGFPIPWLGDALKLPEPRRWRTFLPLLKRLRFTETTLAVRVLLQLLRDADLGRYPDISRRRLREILVGALPVGLDVEQRTIVADTFAASCSGSAHRISKRALVAWVAKAAVAEPEFALEHLGASGDEPVLRVATGEG